MNKYVALLFLGLAVVTFPRISGPDGIHPFISVNLQKRHKNFPQDLPKETNYLSRIPLAFIPNEGQFGKQVRFYARTSQYVLWLTDRGLVFDSIRTQTKEKKDFPSQIEREALIKSHPKKETEGFPKQEKIEREVTRMLFPGADPNPEIIPEKSSSQYVNYFKGNNPEKWRTGIESSQAILYKNLYPHIDLRVYSKEENIEYDWIVKPGGDPGRIRFQYKGVQDSRIDGKGNLVVTTRFGEMIHKRPESFLLPGRVPWVVNFTQISTGTYCFQASDYDRDKTLVIDPHVLTASTYFGGSSTDLVKDIAIDSDGYVYITGETWSIDFPTAAPFMEDPNDLTIDAFLSKFSPDLSTLLFSTYFGGTISDGSYSIKIDDSGYIYISGSTMSQDFPLMNPFKAKKNATIDGFISKFSPSGDSLLFSSYFGGSHSDSIYGMDLDKNGNIFITGVTDSFDFPIFNPAMSFNRLPHEYNKDIFVSKLSNDGQSLLYSTCIGGDESDYGLKIAVDESNCAYIVGYNIGGDFPQVNAYQPFNKSDYEGIFFKLSSAGNQLLFSTYLGGIERDSIQNIVFDNEGIPVVCGWTDSPDFPVVNSTMTYPAIQNAFISKFSPQGGQLIYSTVIGGSKNDFAYGIDVDSSNRIWIVGGTDSPDFPSKFSDRLPSGSIDMYLTGISPENDVIFFSSYIGGSLQDRGTALVVDSHDSIYITGYSNSIDFYTKNSYMTSPPSQINNVILAYWQIQSTLSVERLNDRAWLVNFCQAKISFSPSELEIKDAYRFSLFRKEGQGEFQLVTHIFPAQITHIPWVFLDPKLLPDTKYTYRVLTYDQRERILDISNEVEI